MKNRSLRKRRLKTPIKIILYIIITCLLLFIIYNIIKLIPNNNTAFENCIQQGNGNQYCFRNYGE